MIHEFVRIIRVRGHGSNRQCVRFLPPRIVSVCWPSRRIAIVRSNMCSGRALSFIRPTRLPVQEVARRTASVSRPAVWRWQARYAEQGVRGACCATGRASLAALRFSAKVAAKVMDLTCSEPPGHATHWTGRAMAKAVGVSLRAVQRLWQAHRLQPHRIRTFKRSKDPEFAEKVEDIVGLYMDPPKHTVVVSIDEKSQIQALDRTQPGLPLKPGKCGTMTHDYKRNGTTTLFAALNILDGTVIGRCMRRHRHQEFIRFLNAVERAVPAGKVVHAIVDNYAAHKQPNVLKWLADHRRWTFRFHPDLGLVAQRRRGLLLGHHTPPDPTRSLPFRRRSAERVSSIAERTELQRALDYVRAGDTLVVTKVDRLARSTVGLWEIVKRLEAVEDGGVGLCVLNLGGETVDTKSATGKLILTIFAGFAQFEREMMLERQREGIAKAKAENRYLGRRPSARLKADEAVKLFKGGRSVTDIATALNIGRGSVYRALEAAGMKSASGWT